ncbi:MAG: ankyrin repeat domain-containing protein [Gammaproteobacteria bacterium]|nr:ankyrin repeat domain-containing protein [Gammaproteobacteria bacterium]
MNRFFSTFFLLLSMLLGACDSADKPTLALYLAVERGDIDQIQRHIQWGSDINQLNSDGLRPLHVASAQGDQAIVRLLLEHKAQIDAPDSKGETPLMAAVLNGRTQIAELLIKNGARYDATQLLFAAVERGVKDRDVYRLLVSLNADMNSIGSDGETPLTKAIRANARVLVKNLINHGADPNQPERNNLYPLTLAERLGDEDIIRLLHRNGAQNPP